MFNGVAEAGDRFVAQLARGVDVAADFNRRVSRVGDKFNNITQFKFNNTFLFCGAAFVVAMIAYTPSLLMFFEVSSHRAWWGRGESVSITNTVVEHFNVEYSYYSRVFISRIVRN